MKKLSRAELVGLIVEFGVYLVAIIVSFAISTNKTNAVLRLLREGDLQDDHLPNTIITISQDCTEPQLDAALITLHQQFGGKIILDCNGKTIFSPALKYISAPIGIVGQGNVTLNAANSHAHFYVLPGAALTLENLRLERGYAIDQGGSILNRGQLQVRDLVFANNQTDGNGGAIANLGLLTVTTSLFESNRSSLNGGAIFSPYTGWATTISGSTFMKNAAANFADGGAIAISDGANSLIEANSFQGNSAYSGGAIRVSRASNGELSAITIQHNTFVQNVAQQSGGALDIAGDVFLAYNLITENGCKIGSACAGGGINVSVDGSVNAFNLSVVRNKGHHGAGINNSGRFTSYNTTIGDNNATNFGHNLVNESMMSLYGSTISSDGANTTTSVYQIKQSNSLGGLFLSNTILNSSVAKNCNNSPIFTYGNNLVSDNSCANSLNRITDINGSSPNLQALKVSNTVAYYLLTRNSPAVDSGNCQNLLSTDLRGVERPQGGICDIGAVEMRDVDFVIKVYLPIARRSN